MLQTKNADVAKLSYFDWAVYVLLSRTDPLFHILTDTAHPPALKFVLLGLRQLYSATVTEFNLHWLLLSLALSTEHQQNSHEMTSQAKPRKRDSLSGIFRSGRALPNYNLQPTAVSSGTSILSGRNSQNLTATVAPPSPLSAASLTNYSGARSLWDITLEELSPHDLATLSNLGIESSMQDIRSSLESIWGKMEGILYNWDKPWHFTFRGEIIVMRDLGRKILEWVDKLKEIGDIIIQLDPGHAALPWAGFRFLSKVEFMNSCKWDSSSNQE
jgi:hypothetical protein